MIHQGGFGKNSIVLVVVAALTSMFAPFVFLAHNDWVFIGVVLWGIGMGAQSSLMKAIIIRLVRHDRRASGYGIFNMTYGIAWFLGSALMGTLYEFSLSSLVIFSVLIQLVAIPLFLIVGKKMQHAFLK